MSRPLIESSEPECEHTMKLTIRIRPSAEEMTQEISRSVTDILKETLRSHRRASIFLAGGSTPRPVYEALAEGAGQALPWERIDLFWGDERWVAPDDTRSNQRMAREALVDRVPVPSGNVFPMPTDGTPGDAALRYERLLRGRFPGSESVPDIILLGLGPEGHTASLFPHSPALRDLDRWVRDVWVEAEPPQRLTLTLPFILRARHVLFMVAGAKKAPVVRQILIEEAAAAQCPAAGVRPPNGEVTWWLDEAATSELPRFLRPNEQER